MHVPARPSLCDVSTPTFLDPPHSLKLCGVTQSMLGACPRADEQRQRAQIRPSPWPVVFAVTTRSRGPRQPPCCNPADGQRSRSRCRGPCADLARRQARALRSVPCSGRLARLQRQVFWTGHDRGPTSAWPWPAAPGFPEAALVNNAAVANGAIPAAAGRRPAACATDARAEVNRVPSIAAVQVLRGRPCVFTVAPPVCPASRGAE